MTLLMNVAKNLKHLQNPIEKIEFYSKIKNSSGKYNLRPCMDLKYRNEYGLNSDIIIDVDGSKDVVKTSKNNTYKYSIRGIDINMKLIFKINPNIIKNPVKLITNTEKFIDENIDEFFDSNIDIQATYIIMIKSL